MIDQRLLDRVEEMIEKGEQVLRTEERPPPNVGMRSNFVDTGLFHEWRNQALSYLTRTLGEADNYTANFRAQTEVREVHNTQTGLGILRGLRDDIRGGHLLRLRELTHADVFSDFLEMAEYLMSEDHGYKDAAAVLAGGVLEERLRTLCQKHGIPTEIQGASGTKAKKADTMNAELANANVYNKNEQKIITGWLGIRNSAAHARYDEYTNEQVAGFLIRTSGVD